MLKSFFLNLSELLKKLGARIERDLLFRHKQDLAVLGKTQPLIIPEQVTPISQEVVFGVMRVILKLLWKLDIGRRPYTPGFVFIYSSSIYE